MIENKRFSQLTCRSALRADLPVIIALLADDGLGQARETPIEPVPDVYVRAFADIIGDPRNDIIVMELEGQIVGCCQVTYIPGLSRRGALRAQIESVRISSMVRSQGLGEALMRHVIALAKARGAQMVQLTSDTSREAAHRFYTRLGFVPSHTGFKLTICED